VSFSSEPEVPITLAPSAVGSLQRRRPPTPEECRWTSSHSPALSFPLGDQHVVHHHEDERDARPFLPGEILRHRQSLARINERVLGKAPLQRPITRSSTLKPVTPAPSLATSPGTFSSGRFRGAARLDRVPDDQLAAIQARGVHAQEDLPRAGLGHGRVAKFNNGFA